MRKYILLVLAIILVFNYFNIFSQVKIDPPKLSQFNDTTIVQREQDRFVRGWTCATPGNMLDSAMFINTYYGYPRSWMEGINKSVHNVLVINRPGNSSSGIVEDRSHNVIFNTQSLYLEPSLDLDTTQNFSPRANDISGSTMGFLYRDSIICDDSIDINGNGYLVLEKALLSSDSAKILSNIWKNDCLRFYNTKGKTTSFYENSQGDVDTFHVFNGKQFYISINLRALNLDYIQQHYNDVILKVRLPYKLLNVDSSSYTDGWTKFNYLPSVYIDDIFGSRGDYRGCARDTTIDYNKPTEFVIKGWMLQTSDAVTNQITISALASFDGDTIPFIGGYRNNPRFKPENSDTNVKQYITKIDVEVYYYGNLDIAIDWIKLETPRAQKIFRGSYDTEVSNAVDLTISDLQSNNKHPRLFRFYGNCELNPQEWGVTRYLNMLLDTLVTLETYVVNGNDPPHYLYATGQKHFWNGSNLDFRTTTAVPFIKKAIWKDPHTLNYQWGYAGNHNEKPDTLNSGYETMLYGRNIRDTIPVIDTSIHRYDYWDDPTYYQDYSTQMHIERLIYKNYYSFPTLFYGSKPWWANLWVTPDALMYYDSSPEISTFTMCIGDHRPKTGEEIRLMATLPVLLGAKGLMYWYKTTSSEYKISNNGTWLGLQPYREDFDFTQLYGNMSGEELLKSDLMGGDYIKFPNDANGFDESYRPNYFDFDTMGIDSNHIYIGLASTRLAIARVNQWVSRCEDELMKLRLVSWYGKGFLTLKHQDLAYGTDNMLSKFLAWDEANNMIDTSRFKTWPIGRFHTYFVDDPFGPIGGTPVIETLTEPWDSTFVDITLLKNVDTTINDLAYIGVQNRRTDPLVMINNNFQFFSTAEFEDSCDAVKNPDDYSTYRDLFYRRNGCRCVFLPFNYQNPADSTEYALLRITELGADSTYDSTWSYGREMAFKTKIDTVIGQDRTLAIPLLLGEGRMFKVQVLHPDKNVYGYLYHSNQNKLVAYPDLDSNGNETSAYRYYLTYYNRKIPDSLGRTAVYFRRSKPISKDCLEENMVWEQELLVSDSVLIDDNDVVARSCDFPSIVVRKDTNGVLKAYIVYSCYKKNDKSMIAETTLDLDNLDYSQKPIGIELSEYSGLDRGSWGNPVINASSNGNYYSWSDTTAGIVAAWKSPNDIYFNNPNSKISFKYNDNLGSGINAQHPSLNVYSHLDSLEDNCSLVWEEHSISPSAYREDILYTRLKYNNSMLTKYKASTFLGDSITFCIRNNIAKLSVNDSNVISRNLPVVSRSLGLYVKNPSPLRPNRQDIVYWENYCNTRDSAGTYLMNCLIDLYDYNNEARKWKIFYPKYIKSAYRIVSSPNITQGYSLIKINGVESVGNSTTLNFWYGLYTPPGIADLGSFVGHLNVNNHSYVYSLYDSSYDAEDKWVRFIGNGYIPHLAKHKNFSNTLWQNRRVYQFHNASVFEMQILNSAKYFYKGRSDEMLADWYIGFENADSSRKSFLFGAPELDEKRFSLKLPFEHLKTDEGYFALVETSSDTIASSWFSIENAKELALKLKGSNNANSRVYIQNKETELTLSLNLPNGLKENKGAKAKYNLINGLGNEFRLLFVKNDGTMHYTEELWIEELPLEEKPAGSFKGDDGIESIDLIQIVNRYYSDNEISIFPNPASEVLYLQANVPFEEANLTVTNLLGTKVIQQPINLHSSPELKLNISFLLPGMYYVNISDGLSSISGKFLKK